jgi:hypothetical protein
MAEHCVKVILTLSNGQHGTTEEVKSIHALSDDLKAAIAKHEAGAFDGDEFGGGECTLYMYGPDADRLFDAIRQPLAASPLSRGGYAIKRFGPPGQGKQVRVDLCRCPAFSLNN